MTEFDVINKIATDLHILNIFWLFFGILCDTHVPQFARGYISLKLLDFYFIELMSSRKRRNYWMFWSNLSTSQKGSIFRATYSVMEHNTVYLYKIETLNNIGRMLTFRNLIFLRIMVDLEIICYIYLISFHFLNYESSRNVSKNLI